VLLSALLGGCGTQGTPLARAEGPTAPPPSEPARGSKHEPRGAHRPSDGRHGPLVHRFERAEDWKDRFEGPDRDAWQKPEHVVQLLAIAPGMTVADLGTGTGYFVPHLSRAVGPTGKVLALDIEPDMVRYVAERARREALGNVEARACAADDPSLADGSVARILIVDTWHHIPARGAYAKKLEKALAPGGFVMVIDFTRRSPHGPPVRHRITAEQVIRELAEGGLAAEQVDSELSDQYVVVGRRAP
jgi:SAM-dependent methyltransferase